MYPALIASIVKYILNSYSMRTLPASNIYSPIVLGCKRITTCDTAHTITFISYATLNNDIRVSCYR